MPIPIPSPMGSPPMPGMCGMGVGASLCREDLDSELMMAAHSSCSLRSFTAANADATDGHETDMRDGGERERD